MRGSSQTRKILILSANPKDTNQLRLDEEKREITEGLKRAKHRDYFSIEIVQAVRYRDIQRALLDHEPDIIHFSGHGEGEEGLIFEDETGHTRFVEGEGITQLFKLFADKLECVVLNACYSQVQAEKIAQHINCVVGMSKEILDGAALEFAIGFYDALGAGKDYQFAYELGCSAISIAGIIDEHLIPKLLKKQSNSGNYSVYSSSILTLEYPEGHVPIDSPFYIERGGIENLCYQALEKPGSLLRIKAPKLMGKTSLTHRILHYAREKEYRTIHLDFSSFGSKIFTDLDSFLHWWCQRITRKLKIKDRLDEYWDTELLSSPSNCTDYFEEYLLPEIDQPLVLGLDEIDQVFTYGEIAEDFLGMLRSWHEKGKSMKVWKKLHLVVAHATEVYITLNINKSPFNVGVPIELPELNSSQIADLATRHGLNLLEKEIDYLQTMVGGHPYLVRLAMYYLSSGDINLEQLLVQAPTEAGIYRDHLRQCGETLGTDTNLVNAFKEVVKSSEWVFLPPMQVYKLHSMGLVEKQNHQVKPRYQLYRDYFHKIL